MEQTNKLFSILHDELQQDSDRSCAIVAASIIDTILGDAILARLVPNASNNDTLLDGPNAPLSNFSSRIDFAYRIGIISHHMASDIHIIRKIRNDFAHSYESMGFEEGKIRDQVNSLAMSVNLKRRGQPP